ncbi:hypothetical protein BTJ39_09245 [Izhakiella australiensis]|uniref:Uncharacterized protein n=1 Tax=Izhakiella australiensis TaxID=1926881 RepID=A0A1S8YP73_9GAMM|nr:hypothetical protein [Izhakiella australiensis]OON40576.1 hypothetical protein BTJ39_09245 [Izhakiella australiensis]
MKLIFFFTLVLIVVVGVWFFQRHGRIQLVAHARFLAKTWSVWLASAGSVLGALAASFPDISISVWSNLPPDIKTLLPGNLLSYISAFLVAMAVIAQYIRQRKLAAEVRSALANKVANSGGQP